MQKHLAKSTKIFASSAKSEYDKSDTPLFVQSRTHLNNFELTRVCKKENVTTLFHDDVIPGALLPRP